MSRRLEALRAMAAQDVSPHERDIARAKLAEMGQPPAPPKAPPSPAAWPEPDRFMWTSMDTGTGNSWTAFTFVHIEVA